MENVQFYKKYFARGAFTKAYRSIDGKWVKLISNCPIKEAMALGWCCDSVHIPKIWRINTNTYILPFYPRVSLKSGLLPGQYALYKELRRLHANCAANTPKNRLDYYNYWHTVLAEVSCISAKKALLSILEAASNFGSDIGFEISPRNVAVSNGHLVFLDLFFSVSSLEKVRGI